MTNKTIGDYTLYPEGEYQPPKTNKPKAQNPPKGSGVPITADVEALKELTELLKNNPDGFYTVETTTTLKPSDLELKIRKEVMAAIDALVIEIFKESSSKRMQDLSEFIQDRLTLLWGPCDE